MAQSSPDRDPPHHHDPELARSRPAAPPSPRAHQVETATLAEEEIEDVEILHSMGREMLASNMAELGMEAYPEFKGS